MSPVYVLVTLDAEDMHGEQLPALTLTKARMAGGVWPLFAGTPNRVALQRDDLLAFYVGGRGEAAGCIVGTARVAERRAWRSAVRVDPPQARTPRPDQILRLRDVVSYRVARPFRQLLEDAGIKVPNVGAVLRGGCRAMKSDALREALLVVDGESAGLP